MEMVGTGKAVTGAARLLKKHESVCLIRPCYNSCCMEMSCTPADPHFSICFVCLPDDAAGGPEAVKTEER